MTGRRAATIRALPEPSCALPPRWSRFQPGQGRRSKDGTTDIEILNYALSLENLETSFYAKVIESGLFRGGRLDLIRKFADNEREHRELLETTVDKLGGKPAAPKKTTFPMDGASSVLRLAATIENGGAAAYLGQANRIRDKEVLAAALSIHSVEARHAATLNGLVGCRQHRRAASRSRSRWRRS